MAAGLGFKDFVTGEVLTAADVDGYLMQGVWVFASAAARDAAVTSPQEGNFAYLKDTNVTTYYTGSAWASVAGASGAMVLTGQSTFSASNSVNVDNCFSATYVNYIIALTAVATNSGDGIYLRFRTGGSTNSTGNYNVQQFGADGSNLSASRQTSQTEGRVGDINTGGDNLIGFVANPYQTDYTTFMATGILNPSSTLGRKDYYNNFAATTSFDGINFWCSVGTITGNVKIYGLVNS
jgi:hypothetical protein